MLRRVRALSALQITHLYVPDGRSQHEKVCTMSEPSARVKTTEPRSSFFREGSSACASRTSRHRLRSRYHPGNTSIDTPLEKACESMQN